MILKVLLLVGPDLSLKERLLYFIKGKNDILLIEGDIRFDRVKATLDDNNYKIDSKTLIYVHAHTLPDKQDPSIFSFQLYKKDLATVESYITELASLSDVAMHIKINSCYSGCSINTYAQNLAKKLPKNSVITASSPEIKEKFGILDKNDILRVVQSHLTHSFTPEQLFSLELSNNFHGDSFYKFVGSDDGTNLKTVSYQTNNVKISNNLIKKLQTFDSAIAAVEDLIKEERQHFNEKLGLSIDIRNYDEVLTLSKALQYLGSKLFYSFSNNNNESQYQIFSDYITALAKFGYDFTQPLFANPKSHLILMAVSVLDNQAYNILLKYTDITYHHELAAQLFDILVMSKNVLGIKDLLSKIDSSNIIEFKAKSAALYKAFEIYIDPRAYLVGSSFNKAFYLNVIEILAQRVEDINQVSIIHHKGQDYTVSTMLAIAVKQGDIAIVDVLLKYKADPNQHGVIINGKDAYPSALEEALNTLSKKINYYTQNTKLNIDTQILQSLFQHQANLKTARNFSGIMKYVLLLKDTQLLEMFLNNGLDPNISITSSKVRGESNLLGLSYVYWCSKVYGTKEVADAIFHQYIKVLVQAGTSIDKLDSGAIKNILKVTIDSNDVESLTQILSTSVAAKTQINSVDTEGNTCLHGIKEHHTVPIVQLLLKHTDSILNQKNNNGLTPLDVIEQHPAMNDNSVKELLQKWNNVQDSLKEIISENSGDKCKRSGGEE